MKCQNIHYMLHIIMKILARSTIIGSITVFCMVERGKIMPVLDGEIENKISLINNYRNPCTKQN